MAVEHEWIDPNYHRICEKIDSQQCKKRARVRIHNRFESVISDYCYNHALKWFSDKYGIKIGTVSP